MSFHVDNEKLLEKYKIIWTKIEDVKNIDLSALQLYDDRYIKNKRRAYGGKVYTNFSGLNVPEDDIRCESFTAISIDHLLFHENKCYLQVYLDNCGHKVIEKELVHFFCDNPFKTDED